MLEERPSLLLSKVQKSNRRWQPISCLHEQLGADPAALVCVAHHKVSEKCWSS
jgi:hypothetical protein